MCSTMVQKQASGMFRGDGDELVDKLIEACAASKQVSPHANPAWIGRELQPFAFDEEPPAPRSPQQQAKGHNNPTNRSPSFDLSTSSNNKRKSACSPSNSSRGRNSMDGGAAKRDANAHHGHASSNKQRCGTGPTRPTPTGTASPNAMTRQSSGQAPKASSPISCPQVPRTASMGSTGTSPTSVFACPAMFSSPKPEALPMPTSRLMLRAAHSASCDAIALPTCAVVA